MKAIVVEKPGSPEVLHIKEIPKPEPRAGWVLIRVKAIGLNRSEVFTRQGQSPDVKFPRVLGIECVGVVEAAPATDFVSGQSVAAFMGGMGVTIDGGYAEYTLVPETHAIPLKTNLEWPVLGALPESYLTAWQILKDGLNVVGGQSFLIRGARSSVGMALITMAKDMGLSVAATTSNEKEVDALRENGADHVYIDDGDVSEKIRKIFKGGVDKAVELVGGETLVDSLRSVKDDGSLSMAGNLDSKWSQKEFEPRGMVPHNVRFTIINTQGFNREKSAESLQKIVEAVEAGRYRVNIDKTYRFDEIAEAHTYMEENETTGKLVVLVD